MKQFILEYADFYHYNALDGHEADTDTMVALERYSGVVEFHKEVQTRVVDLIYSAPPEQELQYQQAGRITIEEAMVRLQNVVSKYRIKDLLKALKSDH
jgi:hypothetical protein